MERTLGSGKACVVNDMNCLSNDQLPITHDFVSRLLNHLARKSIPASNILMQILCIAACVVLIAFFERKITVRDCGVFAILAASSVWGYSHYFAAANRALPELHNASKTWTTAYIDCSHLEATSRSLWNNYGVGGFAENAGPRRIPAASHELFRRRTFEPLQAARFDRTVKTIRLARKKRQFAVSSKKGGRGFAWPARKNLDSSTKR